MSLRIVAVLGFLLALTGLADAQTPPNIGSPAPAFKLQDQNGQWHTLEEYKGKWLVLYFYPKDQTPGCTTEACEFRDNVFAFRDANAVIVGVSVDDVDSHKKFEAKHGLPFTLLADSDKQLINAYGAWVSKKNYGREYMGIERSTFLVDASGKVARAWRSVKVNGHAEAVLDEARKLD